jgi:hypothetical protein
MVKVRFIEPGEQLRERNAGESARTLTKIVHDRPSFPEANAVLCATSRAHLACIASRGLRGFVLMEMLFRILLLQSS